MLPTSIWDSLPPKVRVLLYLHSLRETKMWAGKKARPEDFTQKGMAEALGVSVPRLSKLLTSLTAEGSVASSRVRIPGLRRSPLSYSLTEAGAKLAATEVKEILRRKVRFTSLDGTVTVRSLRKLSKALRMEGNLFALLTATDERHGLRADAIREKPARPEAPRLARPEIIDLRNAILDIPHFVGRKAELKELASFLADPKARLFSLTGAAAIGKTSLVSRFIRGLTGDLSVAFHSCREWDTLRNLLEPVAELLARRGHRTLEHVLRTELNPITMQQIAEILKRDLCGVRALFVFDDLHKLQIDFRPMLKFFLSFAHQEGSRAPRAATQVKVIATSREPLVGVFDPRDILLKELVREMELRGLKESEVAQMLQLGKAFSLPAKRVNELTRGNPLFIELIIRSGLSGAVKDFRKFIESEVIAKLSEDERTVLSCLSVFKIPVPFSALQIPQATVQAVERLVRTGLVNEAPPGVFSLPDIVVDTVYRSLKHEDRKRYHQVAANYHLSIKNDGNIAAAIDHLTAADRIVEALELGAQHVRALLKAGFSDRINELLKEAARVDIPSRGIVAECKIKSELALASGEWRMAQIYLDRALANVKGNPPEEGRILAAMAHALREQAAYDRALKKYFLAEKRALKLYDIPTLGEIYRGIGKVYWRKGEFKEALTYLKKSLDFLKAENMEAERGETYIDLGLVYNCLGKYEEAIDYYYRAIELFKARKWIHPMARAYNSLGIQYLDLKDYDNAIKAWTRCYLLSKKTQNKKGMIVSLMNLSDPYSIKGDFNKALRCIQKAMKIAEDTGDQLSIAGGFSNFGQVYARMKDWEKSFSYFEKSLTILRKYSIPYEIAMKLFYYGEALKNSGELDKANAILMEALHLFQQCKARKRVEEVKDLLRDIALKRRQG
ncbi:MAG: tetratricopeptide repeat protein [Thermoplasmata archaeon]